MTVQRREFWRWRFGAPPTGLSKDCPKNWAFFCHVECTSNCQGWRWWCKLSNIFDVIIVLATNVIPVPWLDQSFQGGWQPKMFNNFRWFSLFFKKNLPSKLFFSSASGKFQMNFRNSGGPFLVSLFCRPPGPRFREFLLIIWRPQVSRNLTSGSRFPTKATLMSVEGELFHGWQLPSLKLT